MRAVIAVLFVLAGCAGPAVEDVAIDAAVVGVSAAGAGAGKVRKQ